MKSDTSRSAKRLLVEEENNYISQKNNIFNTYSSLTKAKKNKGKSSSSMLYDTTETIAPTNSYSTYYETNEPTPSFKQNKILTNHPTASGSSSSLPIMEIVLISAPPIYYPTAASTTNAPTAIIYNLKNNEKIAKLSDIKETNSPTTSTITTTTTKVAEEEVVVSYIVPAVSEQQKKIVKHEDKSQSQQESDDYDDACSSMKTGKYTTTINPIYIKFNYEVLYNTKKSISNILKYFEKEMQEIITNVIFKCQQTEPDNNPSSLVNHHHRNLKYHYNTNVYEQRRNSIIDTNSYNYGIKSFSAQPQDEVLGSCKSIITNNIDNIEEESQCKSVAGIITIYLDDDTNNNSPEDAVQETFSIIRNAMIHNEKFINNVNQGILKVLFVENMNNDNDNNIEEQLLEVLALKDNHTTSKTTKLSSLGITCILVACFGAFIVFGLVMKRRRRIKTTQSKSRSSSSKKKKKTIPTATTKDSSFPPSIKHGGTHDHSMTNNKLQIKNNITKKSDHEKKKQPENRQMVVQSHSEDTSSITTYLNKYDHGILGIQKVQQQYSDNYYEYSSIQDTVTL